MPELPEVETTLKGILPYLKNQKITQLIIRNHRLRWPILKNLPQLVQNQKILSAKRRGKYILIHLQKGTLILHLGMSGSIRILKEFKQPEKHDHIDIQLGNGITLRFTDPRRFGAFIWTQDDPEKHPLLKQLGPEPLSRLLTGKYLFQRAQRRKMAIKPFIMDNKIVVGVGNIYATEALFAARIHPHTSAGQLKLSEYEKLAQEIKKVLRLAIKKGGTTLRNFSHGEGKPGYFVQKLKAYGRANSPCPRCANPLKELRIGQRGTVFCEKCQKR